MSNKPTKNQHYVTSALLKFFLNKDGKIFEFLVNDSAKEPYPTIPDNAMSAKFIYEHELLKINTIENAFANSIDGRLPTVVREIIDHIEESKISGDLKIVHENIKESMGIFLLAYYRSGALLTEFSMDGDEKKIELMLRKILDTAYINKLSQTINSFYKFAIIESDNNFLISDQYISTAALKTKSHFVETSNRNIGLRETIILIPLSSKYYAVFWNSDSGNIFNESHINIVDDSISENINRVILNNSYKKCVGSKKEVCDVVQEKFLFESPSSILAPGFYFIKKKEVFWEEKEAFFWKSFKRHDLPEKFDKIERNDPCPCKSGKKFKKCHLGYETWWNDLTAVFNGYPFVHVMGGNKKYIIDGAPIIEGPIDQRHKNPKK